jgi:DedD protein
VNEILKQRLVGALILLALGVVFWPIVFVGPHEKKAAEQESIPQPPGVSTAPIDVPDQTGLRGSPELAATNDAPSVAAPPATTPPGGAVSEESKAPVLPAPSASTMESKAQSEPGSPATPAKGEVRSEPPQRLAMDAQGVPVAWTLQVATVSSAEKAETLRSQLLVMKEKVYVTTVRTGGKNLYRVCIGPKFERAELEKLKAGINAKFGVTSMVVRYTP